MRTNHNKLIDTDTHGIMTPHEYKYRTIVSRVLVKSKTELRCDTQNQRFNCFVINRVSFFLFFRSCCWVSLIWQRARARYIYSDEFTPLSTRDWRRKVMHKPVLFDERASQRAHIRSRYWRYVTLALQVQFDFSSILQWIEKTHI